MGSQNTTFNLIFDTASPWSWVFNDSSGISEASKQRFNCSASTTCNYTMGASGDYQTARFYLYSISQNVQGVIASDFVNFGDGEIFKQTFLVVENLTPDYLIPSPADGYCGLGPHSSTTFPTLLDELVSQNKISQRVFGLYLDNNPEALDESGSEIIFGGINTNLIVGDFYNVSIENSSGWQTSLNGLLLQTADTVGEVTINASVVLIDSGVPSIRMTKTDFLAIRDAFKNIFNLTCGNDIQTNAFECLCSDGDLSAFPNFSFNLDGKLVDLPPSAYIQPKENTCVLLVDGQLGSLGSGETANASNSTNSITDFTTFMILGDPFLRYYYSVYDLDSRTMSFAKAATPVSRVITSLEVVYIAFGIFIVLMFIVLIVCIGRLFRSQNKVSRKESSLPEGAKLEVNTNLKTESGSVQPLLIG